MAVRWRTKKTTSPQSPPSLTPVTVPDRYREAEKALNDAIQKSQFPKPEFPKLHGHEDELDLQTFKTSNVEALRDYMAQVKSPTNEVVAGAKESDSNGNTRLKDVGLNRGKSPRISVKEIGSPQIPTSREQYKANGPLPRVNVTVQSHGLTVTGGNPAQQPPLPSVNPAREVPKLPTTDLGTTNNQATRFWGIRRTKKANVPKASPSADPEKANPKPGTRRTPDKSSVEPPTESEKQLDPRTHEDDSNVAHPESAKPNTRPAPPVTTSPVASLQDMPATTGRLDIQFAETTQNVYILSTSLPSTALLAFLTATNPDKSIATDSSTVLFHRLPNSSVPRYPHDNPALPSPRVVRLRPK